MKKNIIITNIEITFIISSGINGPDINEAGNNSSKENKKILFLAV